MDPPGCLDDGKMIGSSWRDDGMMRKVDRDDWGGGRAGGTLATAAAVLVLVSAFLEH